MCTLTGCIVVVKELNKQRLRALRVLKKVSGSGTTKGLRKFGGVKFKSSDGITIERFFDRFSFAHEEVDRRRNVGKGGQGHRGIEEVRKEGRKRNSSDEEGAECLGEFFDGEPLVHVDPGFGDVRTEVREERFIQTEKDKLAVGLRDEPVKEGVRLALLEKAVDVAISGKTSSRNAQCLLNVIGQGLRLVFGRRSFDLAHGSDFINNCRAMEWNPLGLQPKSSNNGVGEESKSC
jgi:hypothetical protein